MMRVSILLLGALLGIVLCGCGVGTAPTAPATLEGAWLGKGLFHAGAGDAEVTAQLELLSDGSYRYLILKPSILALTGMEEGAWQREGQTLTLAPGAKPNESADADAAGEAETEEIELGPDGKPKLSSVFGALRKTNVQNATPPRTLTVADDLSHLTFDDGKLELTFTYNMKATASLKKRGDVTEP
ncbi:MAG: hypothetical protein WD045_15645 [Pirellulaceae bacterium]